MKAVYIKEFGGVENLEYREVPDPPEPKATEVLVRVRAAGLNRADLLQRRGLYPPPKGYSPNIPGLEFAGELEAVGDKVSEFKKGDRVFGITAGEAQAERLLIDSRLVVRIPDRLSFVEAAGFPEAFITAHDAVFTQANLQPGETLLIHAVGSGVGLAALQLAASMTTIGTSRTKQKLDAAREFGLDHAVFAAEGSFADEVLAATGGEGVDVILDLVGGAYFEQNLQVLKTKGRLMVVGLTAGASSAIDLRTVLQKRITIRGTTLRNRSTEEKAAAVVAFKDDVVPQIENGQIRPNIDKVFAAENVQAAYEYLESNESFGKVILEF